jgi:hypothetical protein
VDICGYLGISGPPFTTIAILLLVAGFRMPGYIASTMAVPLYRLHEHRHRDYGDHDH